MLPILIILLLSFLDRSTCFPVTINYNVSNCYNSSTYSRNSPYETNLNQLLSTLVANISTTKYGFLQHQQGSSENDPVYGVAWCRGDMTPDDCHSCVKTGSNQVKTQCPRATQAILWKEQCMVRYSNYSFFGQLETQPNQPMFNNHNITSNVNAWVKFLNGALNKAVSMAANDAGNKYATAEESFQPTNVLWSTMAQCMPDLSKENCSSCLGAAESLIQAKILAQGNIALMPMCSLRYENYPFYQVLSLGQSPLQALGPTGGAVTNRGKNKHYVTKVVVAIILPLAVVGMLSALATYLVRKKAKKYQSSDVKNVLDDLTTAESLMFELRVLEAATNDFSDDQKLGQGGFASVYKGTLPNGQEIAVKRLSRASSQGVGEFKNEVVLIANLQHRNLVKLLGFCLAGEEKLLVYEYVPNKSLNYFLFDAGQQSKLNWPVRHDIVKGVARGLLYLHEDSRPRIIHRDLKSGNILLDANMNPKIADFGLARIFKVEQTEENTNKVAGTYGYMAPEYAMHGQFSVKSDVYSFGILVLEIVSGKKITARFHSTGSGDLLTHAWRSLTEHNFSEFIDPTLRDSFSSEQVMTCIHLSLLCVQDNPSERPTMSSIVLMLNTDSTAVAALPTPQCPRSYYHSSAETSLVSRLSRHTTTATSSNSSNLKPRSENQVTISEMSPS